MLCLQLDGKSHNYNQGFSDGYQGLSIPLGKHTQDYLQGYKDGVSSIRYNHGFVENINDIPMSPGKHSQDYLDGYNNATQLLSDNWSHVHTLPSHTNDNYKDFYNGYHDGAVAADNDYFKTSSAGFEGCPNTSYSEEYCKGYKIGYNDELVILS